MKLPFLHNVRRGLATNSSSSHSLVFHAAPAADNNLESASGVDTDFGWDHFVLDSLGEKLMYGLTNALGRYWGEDLTDEKLAELQAEWGHLFPEFDGKEDLWRSAAQGYVDHQSKVGVDAEFVAKLRDPHVVVHGGNDNGGYPDIDYQCNQETGEYEDVDHSLPAGATRESLG